MKQKTYKTKRLILRELRLGDWHTWCETQKKLPPPKNEWDLGPTDKRKRARSSYERTLKAQKKRFKKSGTFLWSIFLKDTGEFIGWVDVSILNRDPLQMANLGWFVYNIFRGQGLAKEAVLKIISAAFADLHLQRLEAVIDPRNKVSLKMARSCRLRREGIKKNYWRDKAGEWKDMTVYVATPEIFYER